MSKPNETAVAVLEERVINLLEVSPRPVSPYEVDKHLGLEQDLGYKLLFGLELDGRVASYWVELDSCSGTRLYYVAEKEER